MGSSRIADVEKFKQDITASLERIRSAIRTRVHPREQNHFLDVVDRIQEFIMTQKGEVEQVQGSIARTKDTTRRLLRQRPVDMVQLLNELDGLEQEVAQFFHVLTGGH